MSETTDIALEISRSSERKDEPSTEFSFECEPTAEQLSTLEHVSDHIPSAVWLIVVCEFCERFAFFGLSGPFQNYIQYPVPDPGTTQPGALDRGQLTATSLTTFFRFLCYLTPIIGAILADQFWGKYKTILLSCIVYAIGLLVLVLSSLPSAIRAGIAFPGLILAMIIIGFGTGGVKSNVSPLMAEQYTRTKPIVGQFGRRRVIIDPKVTLQSMFNWFYWTINIGALSSIITTNIEKYYAFWLAYLIPMLVFTGSIAALLFGRNQYIRKPPSGSLLVRAARVVVSAFQLRWRLGKQPNMEHLLDYVKETPATTESESHDTTVTESSHNRFIDDLKQALSACRVFAFYPFYWVSYNQLSNNMVSQAGQMNVGVFPNDILPNIDPIVLIFFIPVFEKIVYPMLRKNNIRFSPISRITVGFILVSLAMAWTALVQHMIYTTGPNYDYSTKPCPPCQSFNNISGAWQIPAYFLVAVSEIFASITGLEYAFTKAPASMKSVVMSLYLVTSAFGSALNAALLPVTVDPKLMWMYAALSIMSLGVGILFFHLFHNDEEKQTPEQ